jgi:hypothetical protein
MWFLVGAHQVIESIPSKSSHSELRTCPICLLQSCGALQLQVLSSSNLEVCYLNNAIARYKMKWNRRLAAAESTQVVTTHERMHRN